MLLGRFDLVDAVRLIGADDCAGRLEFRLLFEERATGDPLLLEVRELAPSVYEPYLGPSHHESEGHRFVEGHRMIAAAPDEFSDHTRIGERDFCIRRHRRVRTLPESGLRSRALAEYAFVAGRVLARSHARSGDARAIADYLGPGDRAGDAFGAFAFAYAEQNRADHARLAANAGGWPGCP